MSIREKYKRLAPDIVSSSEIAAAADVGLSAVSNWVQRWEDFPPPLDTFGSTRLYARDEVKDCLVRHGLTVSWKDGRTS